MREFKCPNCGGATGQESMASLMIVCEYCGAGLITDKEAIEVAGEMSLLSDPESLFYVGATGKIQKRPFWCVGRVQYKYRSGFWDEWYLQYEDHHSHIWISQDEGEYSLEKPLSGGSFPGWEALRPGSPIKVGSLNLTVDEKDVAECVGGQGELPFVLLKGETIPYADCSDGSNFATLEYDEEAGPTCFQGIVLPGEEVRVDPLN